MTCYSYINAAVCEVNESPIPGVKIVVHVSLPPSINRPCRLSSTPTSAMTDRGMIVIRGFPLYGKHTPRLQASSLYGRKSPRSCLYISAVDALRSILIFSRARRRISWLAYSPSLQGVLGGRVTR